MKKKIMKIKISDYIIISYDAKHKNLLFDSYIFFNHLSFLKHNSSNINFPYHLNIDSSYYIFDIFRVIMVNIFGYLLYLSWVYVKYL